MVHSKDLISTCQRVQCPCWTHELWDEALFFDPLNYDFWLCASQWLYSAVNGCAVQAVVISSAFVNALTDKGVVFKWGMKSLFSLPGFGHQDLWPVPECADSGYRCYFPAWFIHQQWCIQFSPAGTASTNRCQHEISYTCRSGRRMMSWSFAPNIYNFCLRRWLNQPLSLLL